LIKISWKNNSKVLYAAEVSVSQDGKTTTVNYTDFRGKAPEKGTDVFEKRGPIVEEQALISALRNKQIAGAAIDVFDTEPLPSSHPFRTLDNVLATPHIGYVSHGLYKTFYEDTVSNIRKWLDTH
jgi:hypothetical protein